MRRNIKLTALLLIGISALFMSCGCTTAKTDTDSALRNEEERANPAFSKSEGKHAVMTLNDSIKVGVTIPDTVAGNAFIDKLPYSVTVSRASEDLCGSEDETLSYDETENEGWNLGYAGWFGGWFTIACVQSEQFSSMKVPIVAKIDEQDIATVTALKGNVRIRIDMEDAGNETKKEENTMKLIINDTVLIADMEDNSSAKALSDLLKKGDITINMRDYANMEKVGSFGRSLPTNDEYITTEAGDLILYQGSAFVIYYAPNSWNFTRLGKIRSVTATELKKILGSGDVSVTLSI